MSAINDNEKIMIPTVHTNGTSATELMKQVERAYSALSGAMDALRGMQPHPRDYYVQSGEFDHSVPTDQKPSVKAARQHRQRCEALDKIIREIEVIGVGILDQGGK